MKINTIQAVLGLSFFGSIKAGGLGLGPRNLNHVGTAEDPWGTSPVESPMVAPVDAPFYSPVESPTFDAPFYSPVESPTCIPTQPSPEAPSCGGNDAVRFKFKLMTDNFGSETNWNIREVSEDGIINLFETLYEADVCGLQSNTLHMFPSANDDDYYCLEEGKRYVFSIFDSWGDGLVEGDDGYVEGYLGVNQQTPIFIVNAEFGSSAKAFFDLTEAPIEAPTQPPTEPGLEAPAEFDVILSASSGCAFTAGTDNIGTITCTFITKGAAGYTVDSTLYNVDCSTAAQPGVSLDKSDDEFNPQQPYPNPTQYESNYVVTIPILNSAAAEGSTSIEICLKTEVRDMNGDVYDWTHTKITKGIDINGGFSTDNSLSTVTFDGDASDKNLEESSFGVGINRCDENGVEVNNGATLAVGENFFLCVKGSQSQVVISNIKEMTATKTDPTLSLSIVTEEGDGSGEGNLNSNTFVYGNGQNQVVIATRLPAFFFASDGAVTFSGSANIVVGNEVSPDTRRRLSRSMQVASASSEESANFSMVIQVAGMDDASSASAIKTIAAMFFAAAVAALIV